MTTWKTIRKLAATLGGAALLSAISFNNAFAAPLSITDGPLFLNSVAAPLNMLVMSRDHRMYYEAYNDASDLNGDNVIDIGYLPAKIDYYGYFDSKMCYDYTSGIFEPSGAAGTNKTCAGNWSGDWLNYVTTSRIDAMRKVLYGGLRYIDTASTTVLQRSYIPQDAHSWGKDYQSVARDGYDISQYTPYALPTTGTRHLFANTTPSGDTAVAGPQTNAAIIGVPLPKLRVLTNRNNRIWEWVSKETPVASTQIDNTQHGGGAADGVTPTDFVVRVRVCVTGKDALTNSGCKQYASGYKPTGLLQDFGENDSMMFGLLTGSYGKPHDGGVLRKGVNSIRDEIDLSTGQFVYGQNPPGIISTIDRLRITGYNGTSYTCGLIATSADSGGSCSMWGNPTAEMMYEAVRYFAGKSASNSDFSSGANNSEETALGLKMVTPWTTSTNPYGTGKFPTCAKPFETVISDISPSFDSDKVPGSPFTGYSGDVAGLNATTLGNTIWSKEIGSTLGAKYFIGQSGANYDGAPTGKTVSSFANIRGLAPEAPAKEGSYNAASVANFALSNDLNPASGDQKMQTFAVALASPLPKFDIDVNGHTISIVPFAKSVGGGYGINAAVGSYQPTNQIVDFYVEPGAVGSNSGRFRVNFEDVEQGSDHDMDAIAIYDYSVSGGTLNLTVTSEYAAGGIIQHLGYVISGSSQDGTYLVVRDADTAAASDVRYFLDTPPGQPPGGNYNLPLPGKGVPTLRTFTPGTVPAATYLKDPLWYAAKWGGFTDSNKDGTPDLTAEWDADNDGIPDNYFLVTNALKLKQQLGAAFSSILAKSGSASSASVSSGSISESTRVYQATFEARNWAGHLAAYVLGTGKDTTGDNIPDSVEGQIGALAWDAALQMPAPASRKIFTVLPTAANPASGIYRAVTPFQWSSLGAAEQTLLATPTPDALGQDRLNFLRGDRSKEQPSGGFRKRDVVLGDIINSAPVFVGAPPFRFPDSLEGPNYSEFRTANLNRKQVVYVGANDGMLHAFDAGTGVELFGFIPRGVFKNLYRLTQPTYSHRYYVDGSPSVTDAFYDSAWHSVLTAGLNKGGQSVYALDVTDPILTEATAGNSFLWEFTDEEDADLGFTYSRPAVAKMHDGQWVAIFGNGYNNTDNSNGDTHVSPLGRAALYVVNIQTGALIRKISVPAGMAQDPEGLSRPNGLATPIVVDLDGDSVADYVYAGDLFGNLWKFDITSTTASSWDVANKVSGVPVPLFVARNGSGKAQPITERPQVAVGPGGVGMVVLFGTGKFLEPADRNIATLQVQSFYGLYDKNSGAPTDVITSRASLEAQTIISESVKTVGGAPMPIRVTSANPVDPTAKRGWFLDFVPPAGFQGEMQVSDPVLRDGRVIFTTLIPDTDICAYGGRSWLMELNLLTGSRLAYSPFDLNKDKSFNKSDYVDVVINGVTVSVPVSGLGSSSIMARPAVVAGQGTEYTIISTSGGDGSGSGLGKDGSNDSLQTRGPPGAVGRQSWRQLR